MTYSRTLTLAQHIASLITAAENCAKTGNKEWLGKHVERLNMLSRNFLPSGSGIDSGTTIDLDKSNGAKIVLNTAFHHMGEHGMYTTWTDHTVTIRPAFQGFDIAISGRNRNDIKEYLHDVFSHCLAQMIVETAEGYSLASQSSNTA